MSKCRNVEMSKCRNVEMSKCRNVEMSKCENVKICHPTPSQNLVQIFRPPGQHLACTAHHGVSIHVDIHHAVSREITRAFSRELYIEKIKLPKVSPDLISSSMCGIGLTEVFVGLLFHHRVSNTSNRLLLKNGT